MRDTERERQRHRQRERQAPCGEPDVGLDPRTPGSQPKPKAEATQVPPEGGFRGIRAHNAWKRGQKTGLW